MKRAENINVKNTNEKDTENAFSNQSRVFDEIYNQNIIIQYKRDRVRNHVNLYLKNKSSILELNSGTGEDAIYFAKLGHKVHATDISEGMQKVLLRKVLVENLEEKISTELCSFTDLYNLKNKGPFDLIFSNFAGLNCTEYLDKVLESFYSLLKPNGVITLVILPKFCLWESLLVFRGNFKTAFRRFFSSNGRLAHLDGYYFKCWYYQPSYIIKCLKNQFDLLSLEGLCTLIPPSYLEGFALNYPKSYKYLMGLENRLKNKYPWKQIGDYYIISMKKKSIK